MPIGIDLKLEFVHAKPKPASRAPRSWTGFSAELIDLSGGDGFKYRRCGGTHYLALHDIYLTDGETSVDGAAIGTARDLRRTIAFIPPGHEVTGWSVPKPGKHSFIAMYFDPRELSVDLERQYDALDLRPMVYVRNGAVEAKCRQMIDFLKEGVEDDLYAESVCLAAAVAVTGVKARPLVGGLLPRQISRVAQYINDNLAANISLTDLSHVANLSRYHFARAFKATMQKSPYDYVLSLRVKKAAELLVSGDEPLDIISTCVGFGSLPVFARAFRQRFGTTPRRYRMSR